MKIVSLSPFTPWLWMGLAGFVLANPRLNQPTHSTKKQFGFLMAHGFCDLPAYSFTLSLKQK
ncbi:hypothetical protein V6Z12_D06G096600 [Gossypium hirsutum]